MTAIRVLLLGDSGVGKSTFVHSFKYGYVNKTKSIYATVGIDYESVIISINNTEYKLFIFDSSGQDKYKLFTNVLYKDLDCIIYMYDIKTKPDLNKWIEHTKISLIKHEKNIDDITSIIVANKIDLMTENDDEKELNDNIQDIIDSTKLDHLMCSSVVYIKGKDSNNIISVLVKRWIDKQKPNEFPIKNNVILNKNEEDNNCACTSQ